MTNLPTSENTMTFIMRISPDLKEKLNKLAKRSKYGGSASSAIRYLIENAYRYH
jgi:predicted DNA-binding protein